MGDLLGQRPEPMNAALYAVMAVFAVLGLVVSVICMVLM